MTGSDVEQTSVPPVDVHPIDPSLDRVTPPPSFQPLTQEQLENQQQQQNSQ